jgi:uncharacterized glyoxalase superfamily protein PhnB
MAKKDLPQLIPHLSVKGAEEAIKFYKKAFGAEEVYRCSFDGKIMHVELKIGNYTFMLADEFPSSEECGMQSPSTLKGTTISLHLQVKDVDSAFDKALKAGAKVKMPLMDAFWGDRYGQLIDPFGHVWSLATQIEKLTSQEIEARAKECFAKK